MGNDIGLRSTGRERVTVKAPTRDAGGKVIGEKTITTHRNRWVVETRTFFETRAKAAESLRDLTADHPRAAQRHPELVSDYLKLRGAELIAERHLRNTDDRKRFVEIIREKLAGSLERGETPATVRLREQRTHARERTQGR